MSQRHVSRIGHKNTAYILYKHWSRHCTELCKDFGDNGKMRQYDILCCPEWENSSDHSSNVTAKCKIACLHMDAFIIIPQAKSSTNHCSKHMRTLMASTLAFRNMKRQASQCHCILQFHAHKQQVTTQCKRQTPSIISLSRKCFSVNSQ